MLKFLSCISVIYIIVLLGLAGCVSYPAPVEADFRGLEDPKPGLAKVYLFRPAFSEVSRGDSPKVQIDENVHFRLSYGSYVPLDMTPGKHEIAFSHNFSESYVWDASFAFSVEKDTTYFLAVWNEVNYGKRISFNFVSGPYPFILPLQSVEGRDVALRFELVPKEDALPILEQSRYFSSEN